MQCHLVSHGMFTNELLYIHKTLTRDHLANTKRGSLKQTYDFPIKYLFSDDASEYGLVFKDEKMHVEHWKND